MTQIEERGAESRLWNQWQLSCGTGGSFAVEYAPRGRYLRLGGKSHLRIWRKKGSALLRIANGSACRADLFARCKLNSINCVRHGRHYSLQAQSDFRDIAFSLYTKPMGGHANPDEETTDWRAVCGRTACTVRRAGRARTLSDPYQLALLGKCP
jgi:hypothetical protein